MATEWSDGRIMLGGCLTTEASNASPTLTNMKVEAWLYSQLLKWDLPYPQRAAGTLLGQSTHRPRCQIQIQIQIQRYTLPGLRLEKA
jgi:hypothetical protein